MVSTLELFHFSSFIFSIIIVGIVTVFGNKIWGCTPDWPPDHSPPASASYLIAGVTAMHHIHFQSCLVCSFHLSPSKVGTLLDSLRTLLRTKTIHYKLVNGKCI